jgi:carboxypeptidase family protein
MTLRSCAAFLVLGVLLTAASARAQAPSKVPLLGSVRDIYTRDGYLAGAKVVVTNNLTGITVTMVTGPDGTFSLPGVDAGTYTISISAPGYSSLVASNFCVVSGRRAVFDAVIGPDRGRPATTAAPPADPTIVSVPASRPSHGALTASEIQEAMAFGGRSPKLRAHELTESGWLIRRRTGRLFTPFWRVATMTQVAAASNQQLTATAIPAAFTERVAWIVGFFDAHYVNDYGDMSSPQYRVSVSEIGIRPKGSKDALNDIKPVWKMYLNTECDVDMLESVLGRQFTRPGIVAAFPMDAITAGNAILFTYSTSAYAADGFDAITVKHAQRRVVISEKDLRKWK